MPTQRCYLILLRHVRFARRGCRLLPQNIIALYAKSVTVTRDTFAHLTEVFFEQAGKSAPTPRQKRKQAKGSPEERRGKSEEDGPRDRCRPLIVARKGDNCFGHTGVMRFRRCRRQGSGAQSHWLLVESHRCGAPKMLLFLRHRIRRRYDTR